MCKHIHKVEVESNGVNLAKFPFMLTKQIIEGLGM
jgi:hypothetical protein